jgi:hypothetical protein
MKSHRVDEGHRGLPLSDFDDFLRSGCKRPGTVKTDAGIEGRLSQHAVLGVGPLSQKIVPVALPKIRMANPPPVASSYDSARAGPHAEQVVVFVRLVISLGERCLAEMTVQCTNRWSRVRK